MKIRFIEDWRQWRTGEEIDTGEGVAERLIALGKAVSSDPVRIQERETTSMSRPVGRPRKDSK